MTTETYQPDVTITVTTFVRHEGSVVVLAGTDDEGRTITFGADARMAAPILDELLEDGTPTAIVPTWAILDWTDAP